LYLEHYVSVKASLRPSDLLEMVLEAAVAAELASASSKFTDRQFQRRKTYEVSAALQCDSVIVSSISKNATFRFTVQ